MVEHAAQRILGVLSLHRRFHSLRDRNAQTAGAGGVGGQDRPTGLGEVGGAGVHCGPPDLHHRLAVRLLVVRRSHLPDLALQPELRAGQRQGGTPLSRTGLGGELPGALRGVVERLRHRGVRLVGADGADAFVLVEDPGRRIEELLQPASPIERTGPPEAVHIDDLAGNVNVRVATDLLPDERHREQRSQVVRSHRLVRARVPHWWRRLGEVGTDVVPLRRGIRPGRRRHPSDANSASSRSTSASSWYTAKPIRKRSPR